MKRLKIEILYFIFILAVLLVIILLGASKNAFATIGFEDGLFPELSVSARALAMGNAFICKVDDSSSAFYNPAGLGTVRGTNFHLLTLVEMNKDYIRLGGNSVFDVGNDTIKKLSLNGTRELLVKEPGKIAHSRFSLVPNFTTRYFSVGYLYAQRSRSTVNLEAAGDEDFEYAIRQDHGPYGALNLSLFGGIIKFGWTAFLLQRKEIQGVSDADLGIVLSDGEYQKGTGVFNTLGFRLTLPIAWLPTFALVTHNILSGDFSGRAAGAPTAPHRNMLVGFSLTPQIASIVRIHMEINYKDVTQLDGDVGPVRRIAIGGEIDFARKAFIRFGYSDGYGSGGIGFAGGATEFHLSTYAIDRKRLGYRGREDRRFAVGFSIGI